MGKTTNATRRTQSRKTLFYGAILITVAVLLILLSYFMNRRSDIDAQAMLRANSIALADLEAMAAENDILRAENEALNMEIADMSVIMDELYRELQSVTVEYNRLRADYNSLWERHEELLEQWDVV
jgi:uncharacterized membrane protein